MQGDAFSDNVNLTARIEGLNKFFGTSFILSAETRTRLEDPERIPMRLLGKVQVKGRATPITLYEVLIEGDHLKRPHFLRWRGAVREWHARPPVSWKGPNVHPAGDAIA